MELIPHAIERIEKGDEHGLRTTLTPEQVMAILKSGLPVRHPDGLVFWSEQDKRCLGAIIRGEKVITIIPQDKIPYTYRLLAERKARGEVVLNHGPLPLPSSYKRYDNGILELCYYRRERSGHMLLADQMAFANWFDFKVRLFGYSGFLSVVVDGINYVLSRKLAMGRTVFLSCRGYGWRIEVPISHPFELLGLEAPRV